MGKPRPLVIKIFEILILQLPTTARPGQLPQRVLSKGHALLYMLIFSPSKSTLHSLLSYNMLDTLRTVTETRKG